MTFAFPLALLALLLIPLTAWLGRSSIPSRRSRERLSLTVRGVLLTLLVLALAGLSVTQPTRKVAVVFVVDVSDSVGVTNRENQLNILQQAVANKPPDDTWGIVVVGENALVDQQLTDRASVQPIRTTVATGNTHLAEALNSALSLFPSDATPRIVVLSDGRETLGNALHVAQRAQASGIPIDVIPVSAAPLTDVRVSGLGVPARVAEGQAYDVTLSLTSDQPTQARTLLFLNGTLIEETDLQLRAGENRYTFSQQADEAGLLNYTVQVIVPNDGYTQNNRLSAFSQVTGKPRVLIVANDPAEVTALIPALENAGLAVDTTTSGNLPADTSALASYRTIFIVNVPATGFSNRQQLRLQTWVRDLGGGLVFVGGDQSYGIGGYADTPIEALLPVEMRIRDDERIPQLTIAYLVDASGSMETSDDNTYSYLQLAQQAIILSLTMLQPEDRAAVGTFDNDGQWVARFQNVADNTALQRLVAGLQPGGGTDIRAGLRLVERDIAAETAPLKHLILLTDGGASSTDLVETAQRLHDSYGVTITTVGIGSSPPPFLQEMAQVSEGNFYAVSDASQLPNIFAQETVLATRSYRIDAETLPLYNAVSPIMNGISAVPPLRGYVATTLKDNAQLILRGDAPYNDPLLAQWQVGLGRSVAFTSDAAPRWADAWLAWADFGRFWGQVATWTITDIGSSPLETTITEEGELARITLDVRDPNGAYLNGAVFVGSLLLPDNSAQPLIFQQVNAGTYTAVFRPTAEGAYFVAVNGTDETGTTYATREGWVKSYSAEYRQDERPSTLLNEMAALTGGADITDDPARAFAPSDTPRSANVSLTPLLLVLALLLWVLDIAVRRLTITRADAGRLRAWVFPTATPLPEDARLNSLKEARQRTRSDMPVTVMPPSISSAPAPVAPMDVPSRASSGDASTVGTLLKRRKDREGEP